MADKIKLVIAVALVGLGIWGYYLLADTLQVLRIVAVFAGVAAGLAVAYFTAQGRTFAIFARESITEVKKVVWPTRKETIQTTTAVFAFAVVMAIFLWLTDKSLEWVLYELVLGWRRT